MKGLLGGASSKEATSHCRRLKRRRSDPCIRKIPGEGHGDPLRYSCLENWQRTEEPGGLQSTASHRVGHDWSNSALRREWNNANCRNMGGPRDYHTVWSQSEKDKYCMISYAQSKIWYKNTYLQNKNRFTDIESRFEVVKEELVGKGRNGSLGLA